MAETTSVNNGWVESYLDALLSYGLSTEYAKQPGKERPQDKGLDADRQVFAKYYVNQILQVGEEGLRDAWSKATSARNYGEKDARLEYLSWRVWFMKRRHAQLKNMSPELQRLAIHEIPDDTIVDEPGTSSADEDEKLAAARATARRTGSMQPTATDFGPNGALKKIQTKPSELLEPVTSAELGPVSPSSSMDLSPRGDPFENRVQGIYVVLISLHGLVRGDQMELGKDADTGGQVKYVVELARALSQHPAVYRVDLLTRLIEDPKVDKTYAVAEEQISESTEGGMGGAYICRLACGDSKQYLRKEKLWPHIREFADRGIAHARSMVGRLAESGKPCELYAVHGHYADAGEVAALMSTTLGVDMLMTGHSLGRNKLEHLLASGTMTKAEIEETYKISRRIEGEERSLESAMMVFTSTQQEIDEQWGLYDGFDAKLEQVLRFRHSSGRHMPFMNVIPPGLDFSNLKVDLPEDPVLKAMREKQGLPASGESPKGGSRGGTPKSDPGASPKIGKQASGPGSPRGRARQEPRMWGEISRFLRNPHKPAILAMSRPDAKKNITTLVKAFGENPTLRELANLVLIMGNRENIDSMAGGSQKVLSQVLKLIDAFDLYGSVAYPKKHTQDDISDIYQFPYYTRGVFINMALQEPFGLTVIEAAAHGVPTVATKNGGPVDIMATLHHGLLVDPASSKDIADKLLTIISNPELWDEYSKNGVNNIMAYSWPAHCKRYLEAVAAEKRFRKVAKKHRHRLSGSWDHRSFFPGGEVPAGALPNGLSQQQFMDRLASVPDPQRMSAYQAYQQGRLPASDDVDVVPDSAKAGDRNAGHPRGFDRNHHIVVPLDSPANVAAVSAVVKELQAALSGRDKIGLGLASMMGFEQSSHLLTEAGVDLADLDFIICNAGADIWLAKDVAGNITWEADEEWELHIDHVWDRQILARTLNKIVSAPQLSTAGSVRLLKSIAAIPEVEARSVHPHHLCMELDKEAKSAIGKGMGKGATVAVPATAVVDRLRKRLRANGFRAHLILQAVPEEGELTSLVHITPLRVSRSLALRYLAYKYAQDMAHFTVVVVPPSLAASDKGNLVGAYTSDLVELISGLPKVWIWGSKEEQAERMSNSSDTATLDKLKVKISSKLFGSRISFLEQADSAGKVVGAIADDGAVRIEE